MTEVMALLVAGDIARLGNAAYTSEGIAGRIGPAAVDALRRSGWPRTVTRPAGPYSPSRFSTTEPELAAMAVPVVSHLVDRGLLVPAD